MIIEQEPTPRFAVLPPRTGEPAVRTNDDSMSPDSALKPFGEDGLSFADLLDVINPLQHLPIISTLYRHWTGDTIDPAPRIAGDALFGGPIGAVVGIANVIAERETGRDFGAHVMAWLEDPLPVDDSMSVAAVPAEPSSRLSIPTEDYQPNRQPRTSGNGAPTDGSRPAIGFAFDNDEAALAPDEEAFADFATAGGPDSSAAARLPLFQDDDEAAFAATQTPLFGSGGNTPPGTADHASRSSSAGAAADQGGWFAEAMLTALAKYQQAQNLKSAAPGQMGDGRSAPPLALATNATGATTR